jgi:hypothetical protein
MYRITIIDPLTGTVYNPNGTPFRSGRDEAYFERPVASLERAKVYCRAVVRRYPDLCCSVFDDTQLEVWKSIDAKWLEQKAEERRSWVEINKRQERRNRLAFLAFLVGFSFVIAVVTALIIGAGFNQGLALLSSAVLAALVWLMMARRF